MIRVIVTGEPAVRCRDGHPRHAGRGICHACASRIRYGSPIALGPIEQPRMRPDEVLDEWVWLRGPVGAIAFDDFPERVSIAPKTWEQIFYRARRAGDPRAVRPTAREGAA